MSRPDADALQTLLERELQERDQARRRLQDAQAAYDQAHAQAQELESYRRDYGQRWTRQFSQQGSMTLVHCYQSFGQRLDQAVDQQGHAVRHARQRVDGLREHLLGAEQRVASVRKLVERRVREHQRRLDHAERRQTDEAAQRAHARHAAENRQPDTQWMS